MKQVLLLIMLSSVLAACSITGSKKLYEVKTTSGEHLYATSKPSLNQDGFYEFYDVNDQKYIINKSFILYIDPVAVKR